MRGADYLSEKGLVAFDRVRRVAAGFVGSCEIVRADYDSRKTTYYATLAIPATLAIATGALTTWYFVGSRTRDVAVTVGVSPAAGGASIRSSF